MSIQKQFENLVILILKLTSSIKNCFLDMKMHEILTCLNHKITNSLLFVCSIQLYFLCIQN